jgi:sporulation protein YlmC with PRC-barrel domain
MKTRKVDTLSELNARQLLGCAVLDAKGEKIGAMEGLWIDFSTHQIAFIVVRKFPLMLNIISGLEIRAGSVSLIGS